IEENVGKPDGFHDHSSQIETQRRNRLASFSLEDIGMCPGSLDSPNYRVRRRRLYYSVLVYTRDRILHQFPPSNFRCSEGQGLDRISKNQPMWRNSMPDKSQLDAFSVWSGHLCLPQTHLRNFQCLSLRGWSYYRNLLLGHFSLVEF
ncbi:hypothetical protein AVEN_257144-1, partial [Araneus ventricosus]